MDLPIVTTEKDYKSEVENHPMYNKVSATFNAVGGTTVKKDLSILDTNGKLVFMAYPIDQKSEKECYLLYFNYLRLVNFTPFFF